MFCERQRLHFVSLMYLLICQLRGHGTPELVAVKTRLGNNTTSLYSLESSEYATSFGVAVLFSSAEYRRVALRESSDTTPSSHLRGHPVTECRRCDEYAVSLSATNSRSSYWRFALYRLQSCDHCDTTRCDAIRAQYIVNFINTMLGNADTHTAHSTIR